MLTKNLQTNYNYIYDSKFLILEKLYKYNGSISEQKKKEKEKRVGYGIRGCCCQWHGGREYHPPPN